MHDLIKIHMNNGEQVVSARDLYTFLGAKGDFTTWCKRMFDYGFEAEIDYSSILGNRSDGLPGRQRMDYALTLDCAKEISMLQRNEKGKEARRYFIEVEKRSREQNKLSPAEQLLRNAQLLVEQERKLEEHDDRIKKLESQSVTRPEYYTVAGYGSLQGIPVNIKLASRIGREATKMCKEEGLETDECPDPRFGRVKMYPIHILEIAFERVNI